MEDLRQLLEAEILRRRGAGAQRSDKINELLNQNEKALEMPLESRDNLSHAAQFVDDTFGGNLARTAQKPVSVREDLKRALYARMQSPKEDVLPALQMAMSDDRARAKAAGAGRGKELTANNILKVQEGSNIPTMLADIQGVISQNRDIFGPIQGRLASANIYNEQAKTVDAQMRAASQAFGRFMEGGVLRKEDEEKYRRMFPSLSDTPEIAANKLQIVNRLVGRQQNGNLDALRRSGYDMSAFDKINVDSLPQAIGGSQPEQSNPLAGDSFDMSQLSDEQLQKILNGGK